MRNKKNDAARQARYADRMKSRGLRQRKFWLTDEENAALRERLAELRKRRAAAEKAHAELRGLRDKLLEQKKKTHFQD